MATTTYVSPKVSLGIQPKATRVGLVAVSGVYSFAAVSYTAGDVIQMVKVPAGAAVVSMTIGANTGVAGSVTVGDGVNANRYNTGYAFATSAAAAGINGHSYIPYVYSTDDTIDLTVSVSVTGSLGSGYVALTVIYSMDVNTP
jgi:hypothetical protein